MPRRNHVERVPFRPWVRVTIDGVPHTMTETAFIEHMEQALNVLQVLAAERSRDECKTASKD